jgi:hypothetical protein
MAPRTCPQCGTIIYYGLFCSNVCSDEWDADQMITLAVIPARGGSQELKRKNLLPNDDGTPLFLATSAIP